MKKKELKKLIEGLNKELELMRKQRDQLQERIGELLDDYHADEGCGGSRCGGSRFD